MTYHECAVRVELDLTAEQERWCERAIGTYRFAYNWGLREWQTWRFATALAEWFGYETEDGPSAFGVSSRMTEAKAGDLAWMHELGNAYITREAIGALGKGYSAFFRRLKKHSAGNHSECGRGKRGRCSLGAPKFHPRRPNGSFIVDQGSAIKTLSQLANVESKNKRGNRRVRQEWRSQIYMPGLGWAKAKPGQRIPNARFDSKAKPGPCCCEPNKLHAKGCQHRGKRGGPKPTECDCGAEDKHQGFCPKKRTRGSWVGDGVMLCGVGIRKWGGKWFASVRMWAPKRERRAKRDRLAVELGVKYAAVSCDGRGIQHAIHGTRELKALRSLERSKARWQRRASRRWKKGVSKRDQSNGWREAIAQAAKYDRMIAQHRANFLHHVSRRIVSHGASEIVLRDMKVRELVQRGVTEPGSSERQTRNVLARSVLGAGMAELRRQIGYKQGWAGGTVSVVPASEPETRKCWACGAVRDTAPGYPWFVCRECGHRDDRDTNAARVRLDSLARKNYRSPLGAPVAGPGTPDSNGPSGHNGRQNRVAKSGKPDLAGSDGAATSALGSGNGQQAQEAGPRPEPLEHQGITSSFRSAMPCERLRDEPLKEYGSSAIPEGA